MMITLIERGILERAMKALEQLSFGLTYSASQPCLATKAQEIISVNGRLPINDAAIDAGVSRLLDQVAFPVQAFVDMGLQPVRAGKTIQSLADPALGLSIALEIAENEKTWSLAIGVVWGQRPEES